jgi:sugar O-acyltransferase (sialic acid O-acetyltransferase NeuD family)
MSPTHHGGVGLDSRDAIVVFGAGGIARDLVHGCRSGEFTGSVAAIAVDDAYIDHEDTVRTATEILLRPIAYTAMESLWPDSKPLLFVAMGYSRLGTLRRSCVERLAQDGWRFCNVISPHAVIDGQVEPHANVLVMRDAVIQRSARVGQGTVCRGRSLVSHDTTVGQYCYIGFGAMILGNTVVEDHCFIGAGAIVRDGVRVAKGSVIGAGAVIMSDTVPNGVYACAETELREVHRVL